MVEVARYSILVLSILMALGGIFGFIKAQSKPSLISGLASAVLLGICFVMAVTDPRMGFVGAIVICGLLEFVFCIRLAKTKKLMPSGMLLAVNSIEMLIVGYTLVNM